MPGPHCAPESTSSKNRHRRRCPRCVNRLKSNAPVWACWMNPASEYTRPSGASTRWTSVATRCGSTTQSSTAWITTASNTWFANGRSWPSQTTSVRGPKAMSVSITWTSAQPKQLVAACALDSRGRPRSARAARARMPRGPAAAPRAGGSFAASPRCDRSTAGAEAPPGRAAGTPRARGRLVPVPAPSKRPRDVDQAPLVVYQDGHALDDRIPPASVGGHEKAVFGRLQLAARAGTAKQRQDVDQLAMEHCGCDLLRRGLPAPRANVHERICTRCPGGIRARQPGHAGLNVRTSRPRDPGTPASATAARPRSGTGCRPATRAARA